MIGPPLRKLSIRKLPVNGGPLGTAAAAGEPDAPVGPAGDGDRLPLKVALTLDPGAGDAKAPVPPGATFVPPAGGAPAGGGIGAPGLTGAAGFVAAPAGGAGATAAGFPGAAGAGTFGGGGGGGGADAAGRFWANALNAIKLRQRVSNVFIIAPLVIYQPPWLGPIVIPNWLAWSPAKTFHFRFATLRMAKVA